ncbi:V-type ATP synthase subunit I [Candidatus Oleimmundimicrobium sp.]|uniref:V-type ATP synthase subunit I n=1 Tax=Candidatus Oleimmundimicrobium sp. TaxID=3060597 RepID=UPI00271FAD45|nr:V-type ATP synthase subunit I [Candidatus Oleimmundimicrobium sp.]MDO8886288.1 V-type ATP synthase subunit I [Candidatus Oleimmundimicrobium sp.]
MAVIKVKKVCLIGHDSLREKLVETLQKKGVLHIANLRKELSETELEDIVKKFKPDSTEVDLTLSKVNFILEFLSGFEKKKGGFLSNFTGEKVEVKFSEFECIRDKINSEGVYEECENLGNLISAIDTKLSKLKTAREELRPWLALDIKFEDIGETKKTILSIGQVSMANFDKLKRELQEVALESSLNLINKDSQFAYILIIFLKDISNDVYQTLSKYGFQPSSFENFSNLSKKEMAEIDKQICQLQKEKEAIIKKAKSMVSLKPDTIILKNYLENVKNRVKIQLNFAKTEKVFMLEGWVKEGDLKRFKEETLKLSDEIDLTFTDPKEEENPPVMLKNNKWFAPFEIVTKLYGYPKYWELDPTTYFAPFFVVFFGLCIGDVGYGLVLTLLCLLLIKKFSANEMMKNFSLLLIYGGIASMVVGALTGSWFTIEVESLPLVLRRMIILEPLKDPVKYLVFCFILGFTHLLYGVVLEMYDNIKNGRLAEGIFREGGKLIFLPGVAILVIKMLVGSGESPALLLTVLPVAKWMAVIGTGLIVWFTEPGAKSIFGRIANGVYGLYGMTSFIGDTISYSRLMALGMATFLIGWGINIIGGIAKDMIPFVGFIVMAIILVAGHLFNLVINLISAFVHPARLQYVEFFGKFFEGGGRPFKPFAIETKDLAFKKSELSKDASICG